MTAWSRKALSWICLGFVAWSAVGFVSPPASPVKAWNPTVGLENQGILPIGHRNARPNCGHISLLHRQRRTQVRAISYESLLERLPSTKVIDAVADAKGESIVASDVAARAGVSLSQARKDLTALASLSQGNIAVSPDGELIYQFPPNLSAVLSANSAKYKAIQAFEKAWPALFWGVRVSFGVALVASVLLIFSTIFFIQTSSESDRDDRRDDRRGGGFGGGGFGGINIWGPSPFDFFYYRPYGYYGYYGAEPGRKARDPDQMGFLESVFSYLFGDGNPNQGLEERRLSRAANLIRENNGAVTAEQLAPFLDAPAPKDDDKSLYVDESFVLPIVTQLGGEPTVTEEGDIVYVFPELQVSALSSSAQSKKLAPETREASILKRAGLPPRASTKEIKFILGYNGISTRGLLERKELLNALEEALPPPTDDDVNEALLQDESLLQEREYKFSLAPDIYKFFSAGLGLVNLGGALYLGNLLGQYAAYGIQLPGILGLTQSLYPLLLSYAVLFNVIPLARNLWITAQNQKIRERNSARQKWKKRLSSGLGSVGRKLKAAARFGRKQKTLTADDSIYSTDKSSSDIKVSRDKSDLEAFDKLLNEDDPAFQ